MIGECQVDKIADLFGNFVLCIKDNSPGAVEAHPCIYLLSKLFHHVALAMNKNAIHTSFRADAIDPNSRSASRFAGEIAGRVPFESFFKWAYTRSLRRQV